MSYNTFKAIVEVFKVQIANNFSISIKKETPESIDFFYENFFCYLGNNGGEINFGIKNIAFCYFSIPYEVSVKYNEVDPHAIACLAIKYLENMVKEYRKFSEEIDTISRDLSNEIRKDYIKNILNPKSIIH